MVGHWQTNGLNTTENSLNIVEGDFSGVQNNRCLNRGSAIEATWRPSGMAFGEEVLSAEYGCGLRMMPRRSRGAYGSRIWSLDISPSPGGRTENSPGPKAFGPGNHMHNGIALKAPPASHGGRFSASAFRKDCLTRASEQGICRQRIDMLPEEICSF